jgi:fructokinase
MPEPLLAGIEAGGTKFVLAVGLAPDRIIARHTIPTRSPAETLAEAADWLAGRGGVRALGIGSFGPVDLDRRSPKWGFITNTPKPGWADCDIAGWLGQTLGVPVGFDTDVNAAALAEHAASGTDGGSGGGSLAYLTIGTGIGGGLVVGDGPHLPAPPPARH